MLQEMLMREIYLVKANQMIRDNESILCWERFADYKAVWVSNEVSDRQGCEYVLVKSAQRVTAMIEIDTKSFGILNPITKPMKQALFELYYSYYHGYKIVKIGENNDTK